MTPDDVMRKSKQSRGRASFDPFRVWRSRADESRTVERPQDADAGVHPRRRGGARYAPPAPDCRFLLDLLDLQNRFALVAQLDLVQALGRNRESVRLP